MAIIKLDDFLKENDDSYIEFLGKKWKINTTFQALLAYQSILEKYNRDKNDDEFSKKLGEIIFGDSSKYEEFDGLLKMSFPPKKIGEIYKKILTDWMNILTGEVEKETTEDKKKHLI